MATATATKTNALGYPVLETQTPVPSDIAVSQQIVQEVGLLPIEQVAQQYVYYFVDVYYMLSDWSV